LQSAIPRIDFSATLASIIQNENWGALGCGLRFASDAEVAKLAEHALNEKLSRADIKKSIQIWQPDYRRA
jgi:hypothetical protein